MLSLRAHAWICCGLFAALFLIPIVGNVLQASGVAPPPRSVQLPFMIFSPRSLSDACAAGAAGSARSETASATTNTSAAAEIALLTVRS